jgi:hypothetical protein
MDRMASPSVITLQKHIERAGETHRERRWNAWRRTVTRRATRHAHAHPAFGLFNASAAKSRSNMQRRCGRFNALQKLPNSRRQRACHGDTLASAGCRFIASTGCRFNIYAIMLLRCRRNMRSDWRSKEVAAAARRTCGGCERRRRVNTGGE